MKASAWRPLEPSASSVRRRPGRALFEALADPRQGVRWAAAEALSAIGLGSSPPEALLPALASADPYVCAFGAWLLGDMGGPAGGTAPAVARLLADGDLGVRSTAATAHRAPRQRGARRRHRPRPVPARLGLDGSLAGRPRPRPSRRLFGRHDHEPFRRPEGRRRARASRAARALGRIGPAAESALPALVAARSDSSESVREAAAAAVVQLTSSAR